MKKLSLLLAICLVLTLLPLATFLTVAADAGTADDDVADITVANAYYGYLYSTDENAKAEGCIWKVVNTDATYYCKTMRDASAVVANNCTVYLLGDLAITAGWNAPASNPERVFDFGDRSVTVVGAKNDSENYTISTPAGNNIALYANGTGTLTLKDINIVTASDSPAVYMNAGNLVAEGVTFQCTGKTAKGVIQMRGSTTGTFTDCVIDANPNAYATKPGGDAVCSGLFLDKTNTKITLNNTTVNAAGAAFVATADNNHSITINSGSVSSKFTAAIVSNKTLTVIINGGYLTGAADGIYMDNGTLTVNGGTVETKSTGNVCINATTATINGGTFKGGSAITSSLKYPTGKTEATLGVSMLEGASIRSTIGDMGIRFESLISNDWLDALTASGATNVEYGTLIAPTDLFAGSELTMALDEANYVKVVADKGISDLGNSKKLSAALVQLKEGNEARSFAARAYLTYTLGDTTYTVYSDFDQNENVRSMKQVAMAALADVKTESTTEGNYTNPVTKWYDQNGEIQTVTAYSCYTNEQLTAIWAYVQ